MSCDGLYTSFSVRTDLFLCSGWCLEGERRSVIFLADKIPEVGLPCLEDVGVDEQVVMLIWYPSVV